MEKSVFPLKRKTNRGLLTALYSANFLLALHLFLVIYINSTYIGTLITERLVGVIYVVGSLGALVALLYASHILKRFGSIKTLLSLTLLEFVIFIGLAFAEYSPIVLGLFILYFSIYPLLLYTLDIFLESLTQNEKSTGSVRGIFLTMSNTALVLSPFLAGHILGENMYWRVFIISALLLVPFAVIMYAKFRNFKDPSFEPFKVGPLFSCLSGQSSLVKIFQAHFIMRMFFVWMVIYTPIYLHEHIGFDWPSIGIIFTIMLIPYLLVEIPAGKIADGWLGEKELLSVGFALTAISVGAISFLTDANLILWAGLLFLTRFGGALLEIMTEAYFFRRVDEGDTNTIGCFRMLRPAAYVIGSLIGVGALFFLDIRYIFLVFSIVILYGLSQSLTLKDTR